MRKLIENLANLVKVKTLVTLAVITVFVVLALNGAISPDNVMIIISMVVSFYFGTQHEKTVSAEPAAPDNPTPVAVVAEESYTEKETVDAATYSATHPDSTVE